MEFLRCFPQSPLGSDPPKGRSPPGLLDAVAGLLPTCACGGADRSPDRERRAGVRGGHHRRAARGDESGHRPDRLLRGPDRLRHRHHGRPLLQHEPDPAAHALLPARGLLQRSRARCGTPSTQPTTTTGSATSSRSRDRRTSRVIKLETTVPGIQPARINTVATPRPGTPGRTVGFGRDPLHRAVELAAEHGHQALGLDDAGRLPGPDPGPVRRAVLGSLGGDRPPGRRGQHLQRRLRRTALRRSGRRPDGGRAHQGRDHADGQVHAPVEAFDTNVYRHHAWIAQTAAELGADSTST